MATMTQDGVQMDEINWMQQNINAAQDATETLQSNVQTLRERGYTEEQIRNMSPDQHNELANTIRTENDNNTLRAEGLNPDTMTDAEKAQALNNLQPDGVSPYATLLGALGSVGGFMAGAFGLSIGNGTSSNPTASANNANAEPLVGRRREDEYDPATGQMLVTDENSNMKLFYKDEDGNLRVKEKDIDGNIIDRMPNPKEFMNEVRSYQGYSQGATIINVSDTKIEREVFELRVNSKDIFINVTQTDSINAKDIKRKLDDIESIKSASIAFLKKQLSEVDPKDPNQKKIKAAINSEISKLNKEAASANKEVQRIARESQLNQDKPHLNDIKATSNESKNLLMNKFKNEKFGTEDGLKIFRKKLEQLSSNDLYEFSKDGKLLHGDLKNYTPTEEKIVRDGSKEVSSNRVMDKEGVKLIQDKVTNLLAGKISLNLANVKVSEGIESILNSQNQLRSQLTDPKLKAVNDSIKSFSELLNDSKNTLLGNGNTVKPSTIPISDQLKKAQVELENFKSGKTRELSADTIKIVTNQLTNDPEFAKISQPKG